ncbi:MAG: T9SS type A sorting domain-containing protein [Melioribacteraceae bacterium]|nr:T9SS type A sorting domain-containing protein [Melioribacteraceae bacterium]MCF8356006.1 T9SS type A sorting domain-containing protein [Melioribacteraceae bacterium]MCF8394683.1 T9SS type A sorting domain-containing protein [Melioribacteraceae bacterium]MCF8420239.1 T9SS type A sorting domain-containing protein [Melioribacteraceae bacterium]
MKKINYIILYLLLNSFTAAQPAGWEVLTTMDLPTAGSSVVVYNDIFYLLGGFADSVQENVDWIRSFNLSTFQWKYEGYIDTPRVNFIAGVYNNHIYYCGGAEYIPTANKQLMKWNFNADSEPENIYDDDSFNRILTSGIIDDQYLYLVGGLTAHSVPIMNKFNLSNLRMESAYDGSAIFLDDLISPAATIFDNKLYIIGGIYWGVTNKIYISDLNLSWMGPLAQGLQTPRTQSAVVSVEDSNRIYIIGGQNESVNALASIEILEITEDDDTLVYYGPSMNYARTNCSAVLYHDKIFVFGGFDEEGNIVHKVEFLDLEFNVTAAAVEDNTIPSFFDLKQNYPNPFNPVTMIDFDLKESSKTKLEIFNITGEKIKTLVDDFINFGSHTVTWDATDSNGSKVGSGVYIYRLTTSDNIKSKSMVLLK